MIVYHVLRSAYESRPILSESPSQPKRLLDERMPLGRMLPLAMNLRRLRCLHAYHHLVCGSTVSLSRQESQAFDFSSHNIRLFK
ncbi:putative small nuclear ribonucleoprotein F [Fusarium oxysporum f. sp. albedinis]|nr:putative small nuclear ribonucleoprotein F [Fusarium oxysporum f. sp. albedinis]